SIGWELAVVSPTVFVSLPACTAEGGGGVGRGPCRSVKTGGSASTTHPGSEPIGCKSRKAVTVACETGATGVGATNIALRRTRLSWRLLSPGNVVCHLPPESAPPPTFPLSSTTIVLL